MEVRTGTSARQTRDRRTNLNTRKPAQAVSYLTASAVPTMSAISFVIALCLALFRIRVSS